MHPFLFLAATFLIFLTNGLPIVLISVPQVSYRNVLSAPVIGAALLTVLVTVFFTWNITPSITTLAATSLNAICTLILLICRMQSSETVAALWRPIRRLRIALWLVVFCLLVLPHTIGGQQFALFQANRYDSLNYLSAALGYALRTYSELLAFDVRSEPIASAALAAEMLSQRPSVALLYASIYRLFSTDVFANAYDFCLAAELSLFAALLYLMLTLFPRRARTVHVVASAFILGFFGQYLLDINAWSALFAIPMLVVLVTDYCLGMSDQEAIPTPQRNFFLFLRLPILICGMIYMYPEITPLAAVACGSALAIKLLIPRHRSGTLLVEAVRQHLAFGLITLALVGFYWKPTIGFFVQQAHLAVSNIVGWHLFFQAYLLGGIDEATTTTGYSWPIQLVLVAPANFLAGFFGMYFLRPGFKFDLFHLIWSGALISFFLLLICGCISAAMRELRSKGPNDPPLFAMLLSAAALLSLVPLTLAFKGQYWSAGKGLAIISPLLFVFTMLPLLNGRRHQMFAIAAWALVAAHFLFGLYRPVAIAVHSDRHTYDYPYPSVSKDSVNWDIDHYRTAILNCKLVKLDVDNAFLDRVVENYLTEKGINWFSPTPRNSYYGQGPAIGLKNAPEGQVEDCIISSHRGPPAVQATWIQITR